MKKVLESEVEKIIDTSLIQFQTMGLKTTVVTLTLPNGFEITESAACVNPTDYDVQIGKEICLRRIKDKIWELEGYRNHSEKE